MQRMSRFDMRFFYLVGGWKLVDLVCAALLLEKWALPCRLKSDCCAATHVIHRLCVGYCAFSKQTFLLSVEGSSMQDCCEQ